MGGDPPPEVVWSRQGGAGLPDSSRLQVVTGRGISIHRSGIII